MIEFNTANVEHTGKPKFKQSVSWCKSSLICVCIRLMFFYFPTNNMISSSPASFFLSWVRKQWKVEWKGLAGSSNCFPQSSLYFAFLKSFLEQIWPHDLYSSPLLLQLLNTLFVGVLIILSGITILYMTYIMEI